MGYKYKRRKKVKFTTNIILITIVIGLITVGTSYSIWSTNLTIWGTAVAKLNTIPPEIGEEPPLDATIIKPSTGEYVEITAPQGSTFVSDELTDNKLITTLKISTPIAGTVWGIIRFSFTNNSKYIYEKGETVVEITGSKEAIQEYKPSLNVTTINPGGGCEFFTYLPCDLSKIKEKTTIKYTLKYTVEGEIRVFYYLIVIMPMA